MMAIPRMDLWYSDLNRWNSLRLSSTRPIILLSFNYPLPYLQQSILQFFGQRHFRGGIQPEKYLFRLAKQNTIELMKLAEEIFGIRKTFPPKHPFRALLRRQLERFHTRRDSI